MAVPFTLSQVPAATPYVQYTATAGQTTFPYPFPITQDSDLVVLVNGIQQPVDVNYSITGQGNITGGNVIAAVGLAGGTIVTLYRNIQIARITQLSQNGTFFSSNFNNEFNRLYLIAQQLEDATTFCLQVPNTNVGNPQSTTVLTPGVYANKYLAFDSNGNPTPAALTSSGSISAAIINSLTGPQTAAELAVGVVPVNLGFGQGDVRRYGADPTGLTDSTAAIANALLVGESVYSVDGTYLLNGAGLVANVAFQHIYWKNALWQVGSSFSGTTVLQLGTNAGAGTGIRCHDPFIDGGFSMTGSGGSTVGTPYATNLISVQGASINVFNPYLTHFSGYGLGFVSTYAGDSWCYNPFITQWNNGDQPYNNAANFTADCIYFNRADCWVDGGESRWAGTCVHFGPSAQTCWLTNHHPYNGISSGDAAPALDPILIQVDYGSSGINIHDCYLDSGKLVVHNTSISIRGCSFLQNTAGCLFSEDASGYPNMIQVYNDNGRKFPYDFELQTHASNLGLTNTPNNAVATRLVTFLNGASIAITGASGDGTHATVTFAARKFALGVGSQITVAGMNPSGYNQVDAVITASTTSSATYANATSSTFVSGGTAVPVFTGDMSAMSATNIIGAETSSAASRIWLAANGSNNDVLKVISPDTYMQMEYVVSQAASAGPSTAVVWGVENSSTGAYGIITAKWLQLNAQTASTAVWIGFNTVGGSAIGDDGSGNVNLSTGSTENALTVHSDGGLTMGTPTGGSKGPGTINISGGFYVEGTQVTVP